MLLEMMLLPFKPTPTASLEQRKLKEMPAGNTFAFAQMGRLLFLREFRVL
jgi:hypothetical protein